MQHSSAGGVKQGDQSWQDEVLMIYEGSRWVIGRRSPFARCPCCAAPVDRKPLTASIPPLWVTHNPRKLSGILPGMPTILRTYYSSCYFVRYV